MGSKKKATKKPKVRSIKVRAIEAILYHPRMEATMMMDLIASNKRKKLLNDVVVIFGPTDGQKNTFTDIPLEVAFSKVKDLGFVLVSAAIGNYTLNFTNEA